MINYSSRASELGGIVNLVDRRRFTLSRSEAHLSRAKLISHFDDRYAMATFLSPEFRIKFQKEGTLIFGDTRIFL